MSVDVNVVNPQGVKQVPKAKQTQKYEIIDYGSLRNLTHRQRASLLLPGLGRKGQKIGIRKQGESPQLVEQPKLLTTAKEYMKYAYEEPEYSETQLSNHLGISSYINSRQTTMNNPLLGSRASKKRMNTSQKNKINSLATELYDIQSNQEEDCFQSKIKRQQFRLYDCILGQSDVVYSYVFGKSRTVNPKLVHTWRDCLSHEDKAQIYLPVGTQKVEIPYSNARIYPLDKIQKEFKEIFGSGKSRALTTGEEAVIIESSKKYLALASKEPLKIGRKDFDIMGDILRDCKLSELQNYQYCMKQAETHFKLMATKWRYSGQLNMKDKIVQSALIMGKNNFLDLSKENVLTEFLLRYSNIEQM